MVGNKLVIAVGGIVTATALTIGVVSAGAGPDDQEDSPTPTPEASPSATPEATPDATEDAAESEPAEAEDVEAEAGVEGEGDPAGNQKIAEVIAEEFDTTPESVLALHDEGIGFGALFKLYSIARARGMTIDELIAEVEESGGGWAFGKLMKSLTEEEQEILDAGPKNLGELVSGANHDDADASEAGASSESERRGPPDHAKEDADDDDDGEGSGNAGDDDDEDEKTGNGKGPRQRPGKRG